MNRTARSHAAILVFLCASALSHPEGAAVRPPEDDGPKALDIAWVDDRRIVCAWDDGTITLHGSDRVGTDGRLEGLAAHSLWGGLTRVSVERIPGTDEVLAWHVGKDTENVFMLRIGEREISREAAWKTEESRNAFLEPETATWYGWIPDLDAVAWSGSGGGLSFSCIAAERGAVPEDGAAMKFLDFNGIFSSDRGTFGLARLAGTSYPEFSWSRLDPSRREFVALARVGYDRLHAAIAAPGKDELFAAIEDGSGAMTLVRLSALTGRVVGKVADLPRGVDVAFDFRGGVIAVNAGSGKAASWWTAGASSVAPEPLPDPGLGAIHSVAVSPDGERIAIGAGSSLVVADGKTLQPSGWYHQGIAQSEKSWLIMYAIAAGLLAFALGVTALAQPLARRRGATRSPLAWKGSKLVHVLVALALYPVAMLTTMMLSLTGPIEITYLLALIALLAVLNTQGERPGSGPSKALFLRLGARLAIAVGLLAGLYLFGRSGIGADMAGGPVEGLVWAHNRRQVVSSGIDALTIPAGMAAFALILCAFDGIFAALPRGKK